MSHSIQQIYIDYTLQHPKTKEIKTVTLPLEKIENWFDECSLLECDCQPIWETNVVECNCDEYLSEFEIIWKNISESLTKNEKTNNWTQWAIDTLETHLAYENPKMEMQKSLAFLLKDKPNNT
jgi:hypothetical protein